MPARLWTCGVLAVLSLLLLVLAGCAVAVANHSTRAPRQTQESRATRTPRTPTPIPTATPKLIATPTPATTPAPTPTPTPIPPTPTPTAAPTSTPTSVPSLPEILVPEENQVFFTYIGEAFYLRTQTEPYPKQLWYFLQTWAEGMTIDSNGMFYWFPDGRYADRIGRRFEVVFYITDEAPGSGSSRQKYRRFSIDLLQRDDIPPAPTATATPTPTPAPVPPTPTPTPPSGGGDPCFTASSRQENNSLFVKTLGSLGLVKTVHAQQQCVEPTASIDLLYECIGGSSSWLGSPVSGPYSTNNGPRQDFQNGFITTGPKGFRAYSNREGVDTDLPPDIPKCVRGLTPQEKRIASTYNKIGGQLKTWSDANNLEVEIALAVWDVETGLFGGGYGPDGRVTIRFENHVLWDLWVEPLRQNNPNEYNRRKAEFDNHFRFKTVVYPDGRRDRTTGHEIRGSARCPGPNTWTSIHPTGTVADQPIQYQALELARCVTGNDTYAYRPMSMGGPQIMGNEYWRLGGGYRDAKEMFDYFQAFEHYQVIGFFDFSRHKGALQYVEKSRATKDWESFGGLYNGSRSKGPAYEAAYYVAKQLALP